MDGGGVLFENKDPDHVAGLIDALVTDANVRDRVLASQDDALDRLRGRDFAGTLLRVIEEALSGPRRARPEVSFDFWDQYRAYERLKELQQYRPAVFRAIPEESS